MYVCMHALNMLPFLGPVRGWREPWVFENFQMEIRIVRQAPLSGTTSLSLSLVSCVQITFFSLFVIKWNIKFTKVTYIGWYQNAHQVQDHVGCSKASIDSIIALESCYDSQTLKQQYWNYIVDSCHMNHIHCKETLVKGYTLLLTLQKYIDFCTVSALSKERNNFWMYKMLVMGHDPHF